MSGLASLQLAALEPEVWWQVFSFKEKKWGGDEMSVHLRLWKTGDRRWCIVLGRHWLMSKSMH